LPKTRPKVAQTKIVDVACGTSIFDVRVFPPQPDVGYTG
jgi:hypothetical protein